MANYTTITASNIADASGIKLASGTISFQATDANNRPINFQVGGGGQVILSPVVGTISAGAITGTMVVANPASTVPAGIFYQITIVDTLEKQVVATYSLVSFAGDVFNLDLYVQAGAPLIPPVGATIPGPVVIAGDLRITGSLLSGSQNGAGPETALGTFTNQTTWTLVHNFGTQAVIIACYDTNWHQILPDTAVSVDVNTFTATFLAPQSGFMTCFNVGNFSQLALAPNFIVSNPTSTQGIVGNFPFTFGGPIAALAVNNVQNAANYIPTGGDIGQGINAAYAALPATGGKIIIPIKGDGTPYLFSTPIVLATTGKYVLLEAEGSTAVDGSANRGSVVLIYTSSVGTAMTLDYVVSSGAYIANHGLRGITLISGDLEAGGPTVGSANGIQLGGTNSGIDGGSLVGCSVQGFTTGINFVAPSSTPWGCVFIDCNISFNTTGVFFPNARYKNIKFFGGTFALNGDGVSVLSGTSTAFGFHGVSFDTNLSSGCRMPGGNGSASFIDCHFEEGGSGDTHYIISGLSSTCVIGGDILNQSVIGSSDYFFWFTVNSKAAFVIGTEINSSQPMTAAFQLDGGTLSVNVHNNSSTNIPTLVAGAAASLNTTDLSNGSVATFPQMLLTSGGTPIAGPNQIGFGTTTVTNVGAAGGASPLPATPLGYILINVAGTNCKIPFYNN